MIELKGVLSVEESLNGNLNLGVDYYKGDKGGKGDKGDKGEKGDTPVKGKDYFTQEEIEKIEQDTIDKISTDGFAKKADLADVATSGSYNDLKDKPEPVDLTPYSTKDEVEQTYAKKADLPKPYELPVASDTVLGGVKVGSGLSITNGVLSANGGSSGGANADEETIITNADGKLETTIGGKWVDGLVDGPTIIDINSTSTDVSSNVTYDIMQELISKGDKLRAILSCGFGIEKGCLVEIDTSSADTYKLTCKYTITSAKIIYTGTGTADNWSCIRSFQNGSTGFSTGNSFYYLVNGKIPSPIKSANFLPIGQDFKVEDDKLSLRYLKRTSNGGYYLSEKSNGSDVKKAGNNSFVVGAGNNYASGEYSCAIGSNSSNNGYSSYTLGNQVYGYDNSYIFVTGMICQAKRAYQFVSGNFSNWYDINKAEGAQIFGQGCISSSDWSMTAGKYNANDTNKEYAHVVGNGTSNSARSNAYTLDWSGNGTFAGTVSSSTGADYAEYFEWKDGNPNNEDRVGYIVCLDGKKIVKANTGDDILGICSGTAMVLGDSAEWNWNKRYLTDDFGRIIYEDRMEHHEAIYNDNGELIKDAWDEEVHAPKINPEYNSDTPYTKRADRPEWQIVGMMGKLYVRDDGTCVVNGYADVKDGIATKATGKTNMRVMERVNDSIIRVLMK